MPIATLPKKTAKDSIMDSLNRTTPDSSVSISVFRDNIILADDAVFLGERLAKMENKAVSFSSNTLSNEGVSALAPYLGQMKNLTELDVGNNPINSSSFADLAAVLPSTKITSLNVAGCELYDSAVGALAAVLPRTAITDVCAGRNNFGDEGLEAMGGSLKKSKLEKLYVSRTKVTDKGVKAFAAHLPDARLKLFSVISCGLTKESAVALADALPSSSLEQLDLSENTAVGDEGAKALAKALPASRLKKLSLFNCGLTDEGAKHLLIALQNPSCRVTKINAGAPQRWSDGELLSSGVSSEMMEMLKKAADNNAARLAAAEKDKEEKLQQNSAEKITENVKTASAKEAVENGLLLKAAYAECLPDVVKDLTSRGQTPPADAFLTPDENGCTPLSLTCEQKKLADLITPEHFKNAQDVQKLWNAVSVADREQMDGKEGRPSFVKVKSTIMSNAVRAAMTVKKTQAR